MSRRRVLAVLGAALAVAAGAFTPAAPAGATPTSSLVSQVHTDDAFVCPAGLACTLDERYAALDPAHPRDHLLDVFSPVGATGLPAVLIIHGGGWVGGYKEKLRQEALYFAQNGLVTFAISYTLADDDPYAPSWPQVFDVDVKSAAQFIVTDGARFGADASKLGVFGGSAGGHLAALLSTSSNELSENIPPITTAVTWSGAMALTDGYHDGYQDPDNEEGFGQETLLGCTIQQCRSKYEDASPINHVEGGEPSMLMFNSQLEKKSPIIGPQTMVRKLNWNSVPNQLAEVAADLHASQYECEPTVSNGDEVIDQTVKWLVRKLTGNTTYSPTGTFCPPPPQP